MKIYTIYQIKNRVEKDLLGSLVIKRLRSTTKLDMSSRVGLKHYADIEAKCRKDALTKARRMVLGQKV